MTAEGDVFECVDNVANSILKKGSVKNPNPPAHPLLPKIPIPNPVNPLILRIPI